MKTNPENKRFVSRIGWLRAAVLGANDGILSTTSLVIGVAAAQTERHIIMLSALSGLMAGAMSMAAGEYVSVSSQLDTETHDLNRERIALSKDPEGKMKSLAHVYEKRGLNPELALEVAKEFTRHNALEAYARDELGINEITKAKPFQAAYASFFAFMAGGILPLLVSIFAPLPHMVLCQYIFAIVFLMVLGAVSAKTGGSTVWKAVLRICFWGTVAMGITAAAGYIFGVKTA